MLASFVWGFLGDLQKHRECNCRKCALPNAAVEARFRGRKIICVPPKHAEPLGKTAETPNPPDTFIISESFPTGHAEPNAQIARHFFIPDSFPLGTLRPEASLRNSFLGQPPMADSPGRYGLVGPPSSPSQDTVMSYLLREERGESFKLSPLSPPSLPSQDTVMQLIPSGREGEEGLDPLQTLPLPPSRDHVMPFAAVPLAIAIRPMTLRWMWSLFRIATSRGVANSAREVDFWGQGLCVFQQHIDAFRCALKMARP